MIKGQFIIAHAFPKDLGHWASFNCYNPCSYINGAHTISLKVSHLANWKIYRENKFHQKNGPPLSPPEHWIKLVFNICLSYLIFLQAQSVALVMSKNPRRSDPSPDFQEERDTCMNYFDNWTEVEQVEFVEHLLARMCHYQHGQINAFLKPMLQRDFISALPGKILLLSLVSA